MVDLDTVSAIEAIYDLFTSDQAGEFELGASQLGWDVYRPDCAAIALASAQFLGILMEKPEHWLRGGSSIDEELVNQQIARRLALLAAKNFAEADRIRDELAAQGIALMDYKDPETGERRTKWEIKR
jgi:cysteinyl-tRNA synthetase